MYMSFNQFILKEQYQKVRGLGDRLELMKEQIEWKPFRPIVATIFRDNKEIGGRKHTDEILVVRTMLLQAWYGLSDEEMEFQANDRLSFRNFLDFPETVPDFSTIWKIRDRLKEAGKEQKIWNALQHQLNQKGYEIKKGVIQDACFIEADFGRKRHYQEKKAEKHGEKMEYTKKQEQHMDKDGTFSVKHGQVHFGYKNHVKMDVGNMLIREYEVSTASLHDSQIDLVEKGDKKAYRDKGYFGAKLRAKDVLDRTMVRAGRGQELSQREIERNKAISHVRAPGERPFAVMKNIFNGARTKVKTLERVSIKEMFKCFGFNLYQLVTLRRRELAKAL